MIYQKLNCIIVSVLLAISCYQSSSLWAQSCNFQIDTIIPDLEELFINIQIDGATQNDLADAGQGLCLVNIEFNHQFLGDLQFRLISPSGQEVTLIGPTGTFGQTDFTSFNISFVNCISPASPDAGFSPVWDNDQMWGIFGNYSGTYYPNVGCLEDFNLGPVNGNWLLVIEDMGLFDDGNLINVELVFCDPTGISCSQCEANGSFSHTGLLSYCESDTSVNLDLSPIIQLDTSDYDFKFIILQNDTVLNYVDTVSFNSLSPAEYMICGLSILKTIRDSLPPQNIPISFQDLKDFFDGDVNNLCGNISNDCFQLIVLPAPDTIYIEETICLGDTLMINEGDFTFEGEYLLDLDQAVCDTATVLRLYVDTVQIVLTQSDSILNCAQDTIAIRASTSLYPLSSNLIWTTSNGNILTSPDSSEIWVNQPGKYFFQVNSDGCSVMDSIEILSDTSVPQISIIGDTINCANSIIELILDANSPIDSILWDGPSIIGDPTLMNVTVDQIGNYSVSVFSTNQCSAQAEFNVIEDIAEPNVDILFNNLNCRDSISQIIVQNGVGNLSYRWKGPNSLDTIAQNLETLLPGKYLLEVIDQNNFCSITDSITIELDTIVPSITINADTLSCLLTSVAPNLISNIPLDSIHWSGPLSFESGLMNPDLQFPGSYNIQLFGSNYCVTDTFYDLQADTLVPSFQLSGDTLDCQTDSLQIELSTTDSSMYAWMGPGAFTSTQKSPFVHQAGIYYVEATAENGCTSLDSILVERSDELPQVMIFPGTLICRDTLIPIQVLGSDLFDYEWIGPDGFMSTEKEPEVGVAGQYNLTVVNPDNGCANFFSTEISIDTIPVEISFESEPISCIDTTIDLTIIPDREYLSITWLGPMGFTSLEDSIEVSEPGEYVAIVIGENLCVTFDTTLVLIDTIPPDYSLTTPGLITCTNDSIEVLISSQEDLSYSWTGPFDFSSNSESFYVFDPGQYNVEITGNNGCSTQDSIIILEDRDFPQFNTFSDTLNCMDLVPEIGIVSSDSLASVQWNGPNNFTDSLYIITPNLPGSYILEVTSLNGCALRDTLEFVVDTLRPTAFIEEVPDVDCEATDLTLTGENSSIGPNISYLWSTSDGNILSVTDSIASIINQPGTYQFTVFNQLNFCESSDTYLVDKISNNIESVEFATTPTSCFGDNSGILEIQSVNGGYPKYRYSIEPGSIQTDPIFQMLSAGQYTLNVRDSLGCSLDTLVTIADGGLIIIDPVDTLFLNPGEIATVTINSNLSLNELDSMIISPGSGILGQTGFSLQLQAFNDAVYDILLVDLVGCSARVPLFVKVNSLAPNIFVPNAFSPNNDGFNDLFAIFSPNEQLNITEYVIYDRWGNQLYQEKNFTQDQSEFYWDGTKDGEELLPGVYVYLILIEFEDGTERIINGNITLIR